MQAAVDLEAERTSKDKEDPSEKPKTEEEEKDKDEKKDDKEKEKDESSSPKAKDPKDKKNKEVWQRVPKSCKEAGWDTCSAAPRPILYPPTHPGLPLLPQLSISSDGWF